MSVFSTSKTILPLLRSCVATAKLSLTALICIGLNTPVLAQTSQFDDDKPVVPETRDYQSRGLSKDAILLDADGILKAFSGITHDGDYAFSRDGRPKRQFQETTFANGTVKHIQGEKIDKGAWSPRKGRICFTYFTNLNGGCFQIYQVNNCYFHFPFRGGQPQNIAWTARTVKLGETPDCDKAVV